MTQCHRYDRCYSDWARTWAKAKQSQVFHNYKRIVSFKGESLQTHHNQITKPALPGKHSSAKHLPGSKRGSVSVSFLAVYNLILPCENASWKSSNLQNNCVIEIEEMGEWAADREQRKVEMYQLHQLGILEWILKQKNKIILGRKLEMQTCSIF